MHDLIIARLKAAKEHLQSAKILLDAGQLKDSISCSYYCTFSAVRALLAKDNKDFKKHSDVIAHFSQCYLKNAILDKKYSDYVQEAFRIRNNCDYDEYYVVSYEEALTQYERAKEFLDYMEEYLFSINVVDPSDFS